MLKHKLQIKFLNYSLSDSLEVAGRLFQKTNCRADTRIKTDARK
jgi:hypothetical protein